MLFRKRRTKSIVFEKAHHALRCPGPPPKSPRLQGSKCVRVGSDRTYTIGLGWTNPLLGKVRAEMERDIDHGPNIEREVGRNETGKQKNVKGPLSPPRF